MGMSCQPIAGYEREMFSAGCTMNIGSKKLLREVASTFCGAGARLPSCAIRRFWLPWQPWVLHWNRGFNYPAFCRGGDSHPPAGTSTHQSHGEVLNLIGVDYQQARFSNDHEGHLVDRYLEGSEKLVMPDMVNILLTHNPNSFDRAAALGIDLTLAGHSHGGQLTLSFINRGLTLVRPETRYVSGWYEKPGSQLYVSRGIGTTGPPIRLGARPEITVLELVRGH
jgi:hypothetical protein